jgi:dynein heavy chain 1, cytosolic
MFWEEAGENNSEGKQLKETCDELLSHLNVNQYYKDWVEQNLKQMKDEDDRYRRTKDYLLIVEEDRRTGLKYIRVNFDDRHVILFKEVRYLTWLLPQMTTIHQTIPVSIINQSAEAYSRYPIAMALDASISSYRHVLRSADHRAQLLLASHIRNVRETINEAFGISKRYKDEFIMTWQASIDSTSVNKDSLGNWSNQLSAKVYALQDRVEDISKKLNLVNSLCESFKFCTYDSAVFFDLIANIQVIVDDIQSRGYSNIAVWVNGLESQLEDILAERIKGEIAQWILEFKSPHGVAAGGEIQSENGESKAFERRIIFRPSTHEVMLANQTLFVDPPIEHARINCLAVLHSHIGILTSLPRLITSRFNVFSNVPTEKRDYSNILRKIDANLLYQPVLLLEETLVAAKSHANNWLQYQALWDASVSIVVDVLGRNIRRWQQLLVEIKTARSTIDSVDDQRTFGAIAIIHRQIQNKVRDKYDSWQKECQTLFGQILFEEVRTSKSEIVDLKATVESVHFDGPTKDVILGVECILKANTYVSSKVELIEGLEASEHLLQKQRYQFPKHWESAQMLSSLFSDLRHVLAKRTNTMQQQLQSLQHRIREEDAAISARTNEVIAKWEEKRPIDGNFAPADALHRLSVFMTQITKVKDEVFRIQAAKEALGLDFIGNDHLSHIEMEITDLKQVWHTVAPTHEKLNALRQNSIRSLQFLKIRQQLDGLVEEIRSYPANLRSYGAVEWLQDRVSKYLSTQATIRDLTNESLKDRHWRQLLKVLTAQKSPSAAISTFTSADITLGTIWDLNPMVHKAAIGEILSIAQGEQAIEVFLKDLKENWAAMELNMANKEGFRMIIGWELLFTTLEDNLNSLASLKQSPYYKSVTDFQEDTVNWEAKLLSLRKIFEIWVEVQRKWMYLRGIFNNADIKAQLPAQFTKFKSIDSEINNLMKRVASKPHVLELLQVDNLDRQLERQETTMSLIQKALGEYLERQRQVFPRFYFVNNDDLVEILGNSNEPGKIVHHLVKMFSAVSSFAIDNFHVTAIGSREGEAVSFLRRVDIASANAKDWLGEVERQMKMSISSILQDAISSHPAAGANGNFSNLSTSTLLEWMASFPVQVVLLSGQIYWTASCDQALSNNRSLAGVSSMCDIQLRLLSEAVLLELAPILRKKCEQILTETVHQRDITRSLVDAQVNSRSNFAWQYHLRYYWNPKEADVLNRLVIQMSNASFLYGFEYLGVGERLVQTPLTDRCYLTLTQALHFGMGGNPFGPAGTGKTESVKMLGSNLGRFVLVFNCDASFDYNAMGRIFAGLCQVGAWGCFDEFNRLEERILSAVSQQILTIQKGLLQQQDFIELLGESCKLHRDVGIFITMNPGYAGRSNLPDNLKQLFRAVAMVTPDRKLIAQVMLFSQGIVSAEELASKIVLLFTLLEEQLSSQSHYDFSLRALKSVLVGAGDLKRAAILSGQDPINPKYNSSSSPPSSSLGASGSDMHQIEVNVLIRSACNNILPKLVSEDLVLFNTLLASVFPRAKAPVENDAVLIEAIRAVCREDCLEFENNEKWVSKILQLKQVIDMRHGIMLMGSSGVGKTTSWKTLLKALSKVDGIKGDYYVIEPKTIKKELLYGTLDPNTLEWSDGIFTKTLRKLSDAQADSRSAMRRSWIVFDGDVDPEWAENLNSVLDDNKVLTLPSGDRLKIPDNVRIMMEVDNLKFATLATISRCGMVWYPDGTLSSELIFQHQLNLLRNEDLSKFELAAYSAGAKHVVTSDHYKLQVQFVDFIGSNFYINQGLAPVAMEYALAQSHIMEPSVGGFLTALYSSIVRGILLLIEQTESSSIGGTYFLSDTLLEAFASKWVLFSLLWSFGGSMTGDDKAAFGDFLLKNCNIATPPGKRLIDLYVNALDGSWSEWAGMVPRVEMDTHKVVSSDVVISTTDTLRHIEILKAWLSSHQPVILCGPPGSGKTMILTSVLESIPDFVAASLNFSSGTTPELIIKTFVQYCEIVDSPDGLVMQPNRQIYTESQWLVVFCDEINLPEQDVYGTQKVIMFIRQLTDQNGYYNDSGKWVSLSRIQFVGACNPPTDAGRVAMSPRFMRHSQLLFVDYPSESSLKQIYRSFNSALLKLHPNLKGYVDPLTHAMVEFYIRNQNKFTADMAPQYIYSPRELSRWVRALYEVMDAADSISTEEFVRLWAHAALRLFHDRLISDDDKHWCNENINEIARTYFGGINYNEALRRPILFSNFMRKKYESVDREVFRQFISARLKIFYEEELDVPLVIFDDVIEHVLRIDTVLRQPMGHLLLVGDSGVGKTVLTRFVAWLNALAIFQIKANSKYTLDQFDEDLRELLRRVGVSGEKICFIFDENNVLSSAFLEKMNALLASGEIPGLFEGESRVQLLSACRESYSQRDDNKKGVKSQTLDSDEELWGRFVQLVQQNLHVVFTMNPASADFDSRYTTSPALFNRCVVDWFGTWCPSALAQVGSEFTLTLDAGFTDYTVPSFSSSSLAMNRAYADCFSMTINTLQSKHLTLHEAVVAALVAIHEIVKQTILRQKKSVTARQFYISPRDYLDFIRKFMQTENEKRSYLEERQTHIRIGLQKLLETQDRVNDLRKEMVSKEAILARKDYEANMKLKQMIEKQNEAEEQKRTAENLTVELKKQNEEIRLRRDHVEGELSTAEPGLNAAKQAVSNIRKTQLDEVRSLSRPPTAVQLTMEMICIMIGEKNLDWTEIRKVIRREDFISIIVNFDPMSLSSKQISKVQEDYLKVADLDYNTVDRASKACGPLYSWAHSQINYSIIIRKIKPLREEVQSLQMQSRGLEDRQVKAVQLVQDLEADIKTYKNQYAAAIRDTEIIRAEMENVKRKVFRAESLLSSLDREKYRWEEGSATFDKQMSTLIGDCILAGAFQAYCGNFDHKMRRLLLEEWSDLLDVYNIPHQANIDLISFLSKPADLLRWKSLGLPGDELTCQNAILLDKFHRFPLIIDPSGQAINFILRKYAVDRIAQTSFLDSSFVKTLGSAIRFGTPLLVQDVDNVDPILNPVLNKELQKTGGRTLIRLGSEDIDYSPKFVIFLVTRNPFAKFSPDLSSRVTLVNFTITPESLESQALAAILRSERPDVEARRIEVLRLQSEQSVRMRELEESLLDRISAAQGEILDDDTIINALEVIKKETTVLNKEVQNTEAVIMEVKETSKIYEPLAAAMSATYFSLDKLSDLNPFYQFSLQFFLQIIDNVLVSSSSSAAPVSQNSIINSIALTTNAKSRITSLTFSLFNEISRRVLKSLKNDDKVMLMAQLARIATKFDASKSIEQDEMDFLLRGVGTVAVDLSPATLLKFRDVIPGFSLDESACRALVSLSALPNCQGLIDCLRRAENQRGWIEFLTTSEPENMTLPTWYRSVLQSQYNAALSPEKLSLINLLVIKTFRPDRVFIALERYVSSVFGNSFKWRDNAHQDLHSVVQYDSRNDVPIMLCSESGFDASSKVDNLATDTGISLLQIAMGSSEGFVEADKIISQGSKAGCWVLLKNVHLCIDWLTILEKKLLVLKPHDNFRLFLSCEINPRLPLSLLRLSEVVVYEASTGVRANIITFLENVPASRIDRAPAERCRVYHMLAWFNAVVQERSRYQPLGWTRKYQFSDADALGALDCIDQWIDSVRNNRAYVNPNDLPWAAIKTTLSQTLYGGKIDQDRDQLVLDSFIDHIFHPRNYENNAVLVSDPNDSRVALVEFPIGLNHAALLEWVAMLPDENPPTWLGLPVSAEGQLAVKRGSLMLSSLFKLAGDSLDFDGSVMPNFPTSSSGFNTNYNSSSSGGSSSNNNLIEVCRLWLSSIPEESYFPNFDLSDGVDENVSSDISMIRYLKKEIIHGRASLHLIRSHLNELGNYCVGGIKVTNRIKSLANCIKSDTVPLEWKEIYDLKGIGLLSWFSKFVKQIRSLERFFPVLAAYQTPSDNSAHIRRRSLPQAPMSAFGSAQLAQRPPIISVVFSAGDLFFPDSFVIASRQMSAQFLNCSIDELELHLEPISSSSGSSFSISGSSSGGDLVFMLEAVYLEGASTDIESGQVIQLSSKVHNIVRSAKLVWRPLAQSNTDVSAGAAAATTLKLPLYLDSSRTKKVFDVNVPTLTGRESVESTSLLWAQRGACLVLRSVVSGL